MTATKQGEFLIYEEHSVYRREFLERVSLAADAHARALAYSRRTRLAVSVRVRGRDASELVSSYLGGKCLRRGDVNCAAEA